MCGPPAAPRGCQRKFGGAERVDERGRDRIHAALDAGDPDDEVRDFWVAKEKVRDVYLTEVPGLAAERLDEAIA